MQLEIRNCCPVCPFLALWLTSYLYSFTLELMLSLPIPYSSHYYFLHFHYCTAHYFNAALLTLPSYIVRFLLCFFSLIFVLLYAIQLVLSHVASLKMSLATPFTSLHFFSHVSFLFLFLVLFHVSL